VPLICSLALPAGVVGCATTTAPRTTSLLRSYRRTLAPRFHLASYLDHEDDTPYRNEWQILEMERNISNVPICHHFFATDRFVSTSETCWICEGLPGVYSTIWCLCNKTNELKKKQKRETLGLTIWAEEKRVTIWHTRIPHSSCAQNHCTRVRCF